MATRAKSNEILWQSLAVKAIPLDMVDVQPKAVGAARCLTAVAIAAQQSFALGSTKMPLLGIETEMTQE